MSEEIADWAAWVRISGKAWRAFTAVALGPNELDHVTRADASSPAEVTSMSKAKVAAHHDDLPADAPLPVPPVGDSTPDDTRKGLDSAAEHAGAHAVSNPPAAAAKEEIQDDKLRPFFRFENGKAWARGTVDADWTEVDPANARVAAASLGNVDDTARANAAAAVVRAYRLA